MTSEANDIEKLATWVEAKIAETEQALERVRYAFLGHPVEQRLEGRLSALLNVQRAITDVSVL